MRILIALPGSVGLWPVAFGWAFKARALCEALVPGCEIHYSGVSSGSVVAFAMSLGVSMSELHEVVYRFNERFRVWYRSVLTHYYSEVKQFVKALLSRFGGVSAVNGRLHVGYTEWGLGGVSSRVLSEFKDADDVAGAIEASSNVCLLFRPFWVRFRGRLCADGGFGCNTLVLPGYDVVLALHASDMLSHPGVSYWDVLLSSDMRKWHRLLYAGESLFERQRVELERAISRRQGCVVRPSLKLRVLNKLLSPLRWMF